MTSYAELSMEQIAPAMAAAIAADPGLRRKFNATVHFSIDGAQFVLDAAEDDNEHASSSTLHVTTQLGVLHELLAQRLTPQQAFLKGQLQIKGKMSLALKLQLILDATRQQLSSQAAARGAVAAKL